MSMTPGCWKFSWSDFVVPTRWRRQDRSIDCPLFLSLYVPLVRCSSDLLCGSHPMNTISPPYYCPCVRCTDQTKWSSCTLAFSSYHRQTSEIPFNLLRRMASPNSFILIIIHFAISSLNYPNLILYSPNYQNIYILQSH